MKKAKVAVLMGSKSDLHIMKKAFAQLDELNIDYNVLVASAHRTPDVVHKKVNEFERQGVKVFIAGAGMAAHLAGVVASLTTKPVIAVPISASFMGLDALLSSVQMPPSVPVATVAVDGAANAAILAAQILSIADNKLAAKLKIKRKKAAEKVKKANLEVQKEIV